MFMFKSIVFNNNKLFLHIAMCVQNMFWTKVHQLTFLMDKSRSKRPQVIMCFFLFVYIFYLNLKNKFSLFF